jgi:gliding motility-associated-like protein
MKTPLLLICCLLLITGMAQPSKRIAHWYFGYEAGLNFSTGAPVADINGRLHSMGAAAVMCDLLGNLLFYTNGEKIWNRNHVLMPNGTIKGSQSSWQGILIAPQPGAADRYYVFTSQYTGVYYSVVDITLNNGLGDVTAIKDVPMLPPNMGGQNVAGTLHCNAVDYWIVARTHKFDTLILNAWLLTAGGLQPPVVTSIPMSKTAFNDISQLTFSQDGSMAVFTAHSPTMLVMDFDKQKGTFRTRQRFDAVYALEFMTGNAFSPDGTKLYTTSYDMRGGNSFLSQFDLMAPDVYATRLNIDGSFHAQGQPYTKFWQLRLGSDQRIYVTRSDEIPFHRPRPLTPLTPDSLGIIADPNKAGMACNYQRNAISLDGRPALFSLPNFISNFTSPMAPVPVLPFILGPDTTLCKPATLLLQPSPAQTVIWQDGSAGNTYLVSEPGKYYATVQRDGCMATDTVHIAYNEIPRFSLGPDFDLCERQPEDIQPDRPGNSDWQYLWQDGTTTPVYRVTITGTYTLRITNNCGSAADEVVVKKGICGLHMPSAFTPDGNGLNDVFKPVYGNDVTAFRMDIYNRWGQRIFTTTGNKGWDGRFRNHPQSAGTYIWVVKYDTNKAKGLTLKGTLELVR